MEDSKFSLIDTGLDIVIFMGAMGLVIAFIFHATKINDQVSEGIRQGTNVYSNIEYSAEESTLSGYDVLSEIIAFYKSGESDYILYVDGTCISTAQYRRYPIIEYAATEDAGVLYTFIERNGTYKKTSNINGNIIEVRYQKIP